MISRRFGIFSTKVKPEAIPKSTSLSESWGGEQVQKLAVELGVRHRIRRQTVAESSSL
jgi:hypothetical protein